MQEAYEKFELRLATQKGSPIEILRTDCGTDFLNKNFTKYLEKRGTIRELTIHDTHKQVSVVEHFNHTKAKHAHAILIESGLPRFLWAEVMSYVVWLKNRTPTQALLRCTLFELRYGSKPNLAAILPLGAVTWVKVVDTGKLDLHAKAGHFVGYDSAIRGYRIYFPDQC